jgi:glucose-6-phosphate-specific signal transduction histidine kinase
MCYFIYKPPLTYFSRFLELWENKCKGVKISNFFFFFFSVCRSFSFIKEVYLEKIMTTFHDWCLIILTSNMCWYYSWLYGGLLSSIFDCFRSIAISHFIFYKYSSFFILRMICYCMVEYYINVDKSNIFSLQMLWNYIGSWELWVPLM